MPLFLETKPCRGLRPTTRPLKDGDVIENKIGGIHARLRVVRGEAIRHEYVETEPSIIGALKKIIRGKRKEPQVLSYIVISGERVDHPHDKIFLNLNPDFIDNPWRFIVGRKQKIFFVPPAADTAQAKE